MIELCLLIVVNKIYLNFIFLYNMKKTLYLITILLTIVGCNYNNNYQQKSNNEDSSTFIEITTTNNVSPKDAAPEIARAFVKMNFVGDCEFEPDVVLENTLVSNRYQVMQKFNSSKQDVLLSYVYKIYIQYFEGDVDDVCSWEYSQLVVEDVNSGKQTYFTGNLDNRIKRSVGIGSMVEFAGVEFNITDVRLGTSISFSHKGKLTQKQLASALKEMHETYKYDIYHIFHENNLEEDYFSWQATGSLSAVYDYENNKIYATLDDYVNGKVAM